MPHSLVLNLLPTSPILSRYLTGKHLHALFLTLVSSVDRDLADSLHKQKTEKAFTLSPLQVCHRTHPKRSLQWEHKQQVEAGTGCWWRISLLDDALFGHLTPLWLNLDPAQAWHLGSAELQINSILGTAQSTQPWANFSSYTQLYEQASDSSPQLSFHIYTPATFRQESMTLPYPRENAFFIAC